MGTHSTGHCRLVYIESKCLPSDLGLSAKGLDVINKFIENHPRLSYAHGDVCLYFFAPPIKGDGKDIHFWPAREIIGHPGVIDSVQLKTVDLFPGEVKRLELKGPRDSLSWDELAELYEELESKEQKISASTWRIVIKENGTLFLEIFTDS